MRFVFWLKDLKASLTVIICALVVAGLHVVASADDSSDSNATPVASLVSDTSFTKRPYVAIGAGLSRMEPKSFTTALDVSDNQDTGYGIAFGYDLTRWVSAEVYFADLGSAEIEFLGDPVGEVDYQVYGVSGIGYLYNSRSGFGFGNNETGHFRREGLSFLGRVGLGSINNSSNLEYDRDHSLHLSFGIGLEYGFGNGFAVRGELSGYDTDARYASLNLIKRFGKVQEAAPVVVPVPPPVVPKAETPVVPESTETIRPVVPPYIYFEFDKSSLTAESIAKLDEFVKEVKERDFQYQVDGHSDWINTETYNLSLSLKRARSVQDYLSSHGIDSDRINIEGYGETRPVSTNLTEEGRARNRRVEIRIR